MLRLPFGQLFPEDGAHLLDQSKAGIGMGSSAPARSMRRIKNWMSK